jgi:hypothetical protein
MKRQMFSLITVIFFILSSGHSSAQKNCDAKTILTKEYNLIPQHSKDTQYFEMVSRMDTHAPDGTLQTWDLYHLYLRCIPSNDPSKGDEYTCLRFTVQINKGPQRIIPSLTGWKYNFSLTPNAKDDKGEVLGIDHAKFENLVDEKGNAIPAGNTYHVYNAFIDFHSMFVFCENSGAGNGIQNLKRLGDKVIHAAANSKAPVNLGSSVEDGSYFQNGEVTLLFKGLSWENEKTCALLEYDSGQSSFFMKMKPMPNMELTTRGSSHYWGDIYKDLQSGWFQKATLHEMVITETDIPSMSKINSAVERSISIKNIRRPNFE